MFLRSEVSLKKPKEVKSDYFQQGYVFWVSQFA